MKSLVRPALVAAASALAPISVSAQLLIIELGSLELQPNLSGQVHDFAVQNTGPSSVDSIFGLNFALQIGDGTSGPKVESVSLYAGDSIFVAHAVNQVDQGSSSWISFFGIDSGGVALSIPASGSTLLARVTLDTTGIGPGAGPWSVSANNVGPLDSDTEYVLVGGAARPIETFVSGELTGAGTQRLGSGNGSVDDRGGGDSKMEQIGSACRSRAQPVPEPSCERLVPGRTRACLGEINAWNGLIPYSRDKKCRQVRYDGNRDIRRGILLPLAY